MKYPLKHANNWEQVSENVLVKTFDHSISDSWTDKKTLIPKTLYSFFEIIDEEEMHIGGTTLICDKDKNRYLAWGYNNSRSNSGNLGPEIYHTLGMLQEDPNQDSQFTYLTFTLTKTYLTKRDLEWQQRSNIGPVKAFVISLQLSTAFNINDYQRWEDIKANLKSETPKTDVITDSISIPKDKKKAEMSFGHIDGTKEGQLFASREDLGLSGIHTPPQAGIWGRQNEGSASIVLSGGYADDIDDGDYILYTGQGGQDKPGGSQVRDQEFTLGNKALQLNKEYNLPLRVTRGYQVEKGPDEGYRYDGLYYVTDYERVEGKEGFQICRFHLQREVGGSPIENIEHSISPAERVEYTGNRVKRNVSFAEQIKDLYDNTCQVCKVFLKTPIEGVGISEAAHIKAIGKPHNGDDTKANMLCLCPNHHAQFDRYTFYIEPETLEIIGLDEYKGTSISINKKHKVNVEYFEYQKQQYLQKN